MARDKIDKDKTLEVWLQDDLIGHLYQIETGDMNFEYLPNARRAVSFSLPVRSEIFGHKECFAYFDGLLPESDSQRKALGAKFSINARNSFRLLQAIGHDCAGAVSFFSPGKRSSKPKDFSDNGVKFISDSELEKLILELRRNPLFINKENEIRISLAGAQSKAAVIYRAGKIALPLNDVPTTHILKPAIPNLSNTVANEYFCLRLAKLLGINAPFVEMRTAGETPYILVERYDRLVNDKEILRIHQEDFCQAMSIRSGSKYQSDSGPSVKDCMNLLWKTTVPVRARRAFMEILTFNFLIGNSDAHGKNYSILHMDDGSISISPIYDVTCTTVYPEVSTKMAMKIGNKYKPKEVMPRHWESLCKEVDYGYPGFRNILEDFAKRLPDIARQEWLEIKRTHQNVEILEQICESIDSNCGQSLKKLDAARSAD